MPAPERKYGICDPQKDGQKKKQNNDAQLKMTHLIAFLLICTFHVTEHFFGQTGVSVDCKIFGL